MEYEISKANREETKKRLMAIHDAKNRMLKKKNSSQEKKKLR